MREGGRREGGVGAAMAFAFVLSKRSNNQVFTAKSRFFAPLLSSLLLSK